VKLIWEIWGDVVFGGNADCLTTTSPISEPNLFLVSAVQRADYKLDVGRENSPARLIALRRPCQALADKNCVAFGFEQEIVHAPLLLAG